jgi:hypothetical protein
MGVTARGILAEFSYCVLQYVVDRPELWVWVLLREGLSLNLCTVVSIAYADAGLWKYPVMVTIVRAASFTLAD